MLLMAYRQPVLFKEVDTGFPSKPDERFGFFVGFSETVGHQNTFKILDAETKQIVTRSRVRLPKDTPNLRAIKWAAPEELDTEDVVDKELAGLMPTRPSKHDVVVETVPEDDASIVKIIFTETPRSSVSFSHEKLQFCH